jgi:hypothetical protein
MDIEDKRQNDNWDVIVELPNKDCVYLFYPINIIGCAYNRKFEYEEFKYCSKENCPIIKN